MRSLVAAVAVTGSLVLAGGASATESTIYPGVGIGKVKIGMTKAQVVRVLGKDYIVNNGGGQSVQLGWNFDSWTVAFRKGRAVQVGTTLHAQRTTKHVGPGTLWLKLVRAYPGGVCTFGGKRLSLEYLVPHKGGTQTIFFMQDWPSNAGSYGVSLKTYAINTVSVRTPYEPRPEFARDYQYRCQNGWQSSPIPRQG